jgi:general secretion pathway protein D
MLLGSATAFAQPAPAPAPQPGSPATAPGAGPRTPARSPSVRYDTRNGYTLAFAEADVKRVVDAVLGSMLELDYSVDPDVKGNITLRTSQPVARESLLPMLENALRSVNAVILVQGSSYRVLPREAAQTRAPLARGGPSAGTAIPGFATELVMVKHGSAKEIARLLEQFLGKDSVAGTDTALNQVAISGSAEERQAARDLIARFDVDAMANMTFELYRLQNVDADTLLSELERIFQPPFDIIGSRVRIVPLPRLRSVLAIAVERSDLARVEPWITRLDAGVAGKRKLYSYSVQNGRARELATSLQMVLGIDSGNASEAPPPPAPAVPPAAEDRDPMRSMMAASPAQQAMPAMPQATTTNANGSTASPRIVPNESNNSLLIYADGEEYEFIREAIEKLDQPVAQVLIEATLAEVTLTNDLRYGVNFRGISGDTTVSNSNTASGTPASIFPGFSLSVIGNSAQGVLNTLQSKTNVRVLSAPKLMVLNNQTAILQVGDQVPIVIQQSQSVAAPGAPIVNTVELRDTGVILKVVPRVNDSGTITLDISQEVSDVAETTTSGINSPTIQQRRISSTVATRSGQMVALGGLIRDKQTKGKSGIPLLSQIPVVGGLFGNQTDIGTRTELIILLTPTVIRSPTDVRALVDDLIDGLDMTRPLVDRAIQRQVGHGPALPLPPPAPPR